MNAVHVVGNASFPSEHHIIFLRSIRRQSSISKVIILSTSSLSSCLS